MKFARKVFSLLLALALMLSLAVPVMAETGELETTTPATYTVTITGHKTGHTYEAYQIFKGDLDKSGAVLSNIQWGDGIDGEGFLAFLTRTSTTDAQIFAETDKDGKLNKNVFASCTDAESVSKVLSGYTDKDTMLDIFAKYAGEHLKNPQGTSTAGSDASYTISGLPAGYYLFKDKDNSLSADAKDDFYTKFMLEVVANVPVSVKGEVPKIEKTVSDVATEGYGKTTSSMIGEDVYFELTASLPSNFDIFEDYYFTFEDTMSAGLTFNKIEKVYIQRSNEQIDIPAAFIDKDITTLQATAKENGKTGFTLKIGDLKAENFPALLKENTIVVRYSAKLNAGAVVGADGNPNDVTLKYSNNPYTDGEGSTGPSTAVVFTFGLNVDKHEKGSENIKLEGAQFVLYRRELYRPEGSDQDMLRLNFVVVDENGVAKDWLSIDGIQVAATTAQTWENVKAELSKEQLESITLTTGKDGKISVPGLDVHVYHLLEIKAPDGYNLPRDPFVVTMTPVTDENGNITMKYQFGSGEAVDSENGYANIGISNGKGNTLPSTGGMGTTLFYVIGGLLVVSAAVLLITKKRMSEV